MNLNFVQNIFVNLMDLCKNFGGVDIKTLENFIIMLAPFAPHISEELWNLIGNEKSIFESEWPKCDENNMQDDFVNIALQINGKLRGNISVDINLEKEKIILLAKENLGKKLDGKEIIKEIYVPKKIINFVVK